MASTTNIAKKFSVKEDTNFIRDTILFIVFDMESLYMFFFYSIVFFASIKKYELIISIRDF